MKGDTVSRIEGQPIGWAKLGRITTKRPVNLCEIFLEEGHHVYHCDPQDDMLDVGGVSLGTSPSTQPWTPTWRCMMAQWKATAGIKGLRSCNQLECKSTRTSAEKRKGSVRGTKSKAPRITGEGNGTPLQYSCLENPTDGGAW